MTSRICDHRLVTAIRITLLAALVAFVPACEKTDDTQVLIEEAHDLSHHSKVELDHLEHRAKEIDRAYPHDGASGRLLGQAREKLSQLRAIETALDHVAAGGHEAQKPDGQAATDASAIAALVDDARGKLDEGMVEISGDLDSVEAAGDAARRDSLSQPAPSAISATPGADPTPAAPGE